MKYIHTYATQNDYDLDDGKGYPNVGYVEGDDVVIYNMGEPTIDWSKEYLTFEALESGTFSFTSACTYSMDDGETWSELAELTSTPTVLAGEKILFKANNTPTSSYGVGIFSSTGRFNAMGNPYSLLYGDNFSGVTDLSTMYDALRRLFQACTGLVSAENISLPATDLSRGCYLGMFSGCTSLTTAPELPATTLVESGYSRMFQSCSSLTTAPELPATTLDVYCYQHMFWGCTSLTTAPELSATTLDDSCYKSMFYNCTNLNYIKMLATDISAGQCLSNWVTNVAQSGTFVKDTSMTTLPEGNNGIPSGWTVINATQ